MSSFVSLRWIVRHAERMYDRLLQKLEAGTPVDIRYLRFLKPKYTLLSDLKREMPGTYRHSILVGFMAASAAKKIGANPDLTRCIAYYHDIGKMKDPNLFMEAKSGDRGLMKIIESETELRRILAHAKNSAEVLTRKGLPQEVCDGALEHHGNVRTRLRLAPALLAQLRPEQLHYSGPKPRSKESAIVMLADSCEAVLNRMRNDEDWPVSPSREFISGVIERVGRELRAEGQFDNIAFTAAEQRTVEGSIMWWMYRFYHKLNVIQTPY